jgi:hypothetical protein
MPEPPQLHILVPVRSISGGKLEKTDQKKSQPAGLRAISAAPCSKLVLAIPFLLCVRRVHKQDIIAGVVSFKTSRGPNFMRQMPCMMPAV